jgi:hypothetical protein
MVYRLGTERFLPTSLTDDDTSRIGAMQHVIRADFGARDELEPIAETELVARLEEGSVVLTVICGQRMNTVSATCPRHSISRCRSWRRGSSNCRATMRSSPTDGGLAARCPLEPWRAVAFCPRELSSCRLSILAPAFLAAQTAANDRMLRAARHTHPARQRRGRPGQRSRGDARSGSCRARSKCVSAR